MTDGSTEILLYITVMCLKMFKLFCNLGNMRIFKDQCSSQMSSTKVTVTNELKELCLNLRMSLLLAEHLT